MSLSAIPGLYLDRTLLIERRSLTEDAVGDPVEAWGTLLPALAATIQPVSVKELKDLPQGQEFPITDKAYCEYQEVDLNYGDRVTDSLDGNVYFIVSIQRYKSARADVTSGQHVKIYLSKPQAPKS